MVLITIRYQVDKRKILCLSNTQYDLIQNFDANAVLWTSIEKYRYFVWYTCNYKYNPPSKHVTYRISPCLLLEVRFQRRWFSSWHTCVLYQNKIFMIRLSKIYLINEKYCPSLTAISPVHEKLIYIHRLSTVSINKLKKNNSKIYPNRSFRYGWIFNLLF